ncbi:MAG: hypothetical protein ACLTZB_01645 [Streptococcus salivarius]
MARLGLGIDTVCALALVIWLPNVRHNHYLEQDTSTTKIQAVGIRVAKSGPS